MKKPTRILAYAAQEPGDSFQPFHYELGELSPSEVDIDVLYCGICHSDISMLQNDWGITEYPFVGGHEVIGKVSQIGSNVKHLQIGQHVGLGWHSAYCGECDSCGTSDQNLCASAQGTIVSRHGGFAESVRADEASVIPIPEGVDLESAGPLLCGGITVFHPLIMHGIKPTDKVAVIGIGGLGHLALKFLKHWGCEVTAFTSSESKHQEALALGAHKTLNSKDSDAIQSAASRFDFIITTVNVKLDWNLYLQTLKPKGCLHFVGATLEPLDINAMSLIMGQRTISGSPVGSPATMKTMMEFSALHQIQPQVEVFPMSEINSAIEHLQSGKARYRIVLKNG